MSATGMAPYWKMFEPRVPGYLHIQAPYPYRFQGARPGETVGQAAARELEEAILREGADTVAAFIAEPIIGGGGVIVPPDDYFPLVRQICTKHEVLFIGDEVITGFCRTGQWFALTHWNVQPDIQSFAKAVTSGYAPLGGIIVSREIHDMMNSVPPADRWMHAYTYSGHPMCCAVGLANIEIMERERLWERSAKMGTRLHQGLLALQKELPAIGDVRGGKGLLCGVELVSDRGTKAGFPADQKVGLRVRREMEKRGLVTRIRSYPVPDGTVSEQIFLAPPLVISEAQIDRVLEAVRGAIKAVIPG
jgi:adenosylmethionine-8-amino-7-oxononanoate aminotransferase